MREPPIQVEKTCFPHAQPQTEALRGFARREDAHTLISAFCIMELERPLSTRLLSGPRGAFSKEDMEVGCHWVKQICGLAVGITCGIVPVTGVAGFISFASAALFGTWFMYAKVMRVDLDFEAQLELWKEGSLSATATFILVWTALFTIFNDSR